MNVVIVKKDNGIVDEIHEGMSDTIRTITNSTTHHGKKGDEKTYSKTVYEDTGETETIYVKVYRLEKEVLTNKNFEEMEGDVSNSCDYELIN